jgi:hypothetical protein
MLVWWGTEPDPDRTPRPCNRVSLHEFLDAVLPHDPTTHWLRDCRGADRELAQLLRLQASGLPLGDAFGHHLRVSNRCSTTYRLSEAEPPIGVGSSA